MQRVAGRRGIDGTLGKCVRDVSVDILLRRTRDDGSNDGTLRERVSDLVAILEKSARANSTWAELIKQ